MFFCEPCRRKRRWPESIAKSLGTCELCGRHTTCHDVPSKHLPDPPAPVPPPDPRDTIIAGLEAEVERLQAAIRKHRDQKGDNRCWMDDQDLYAVLGAESIHADTSLPPREEFLESCRRFYSQRQAPHDGVGRHDCMTITQLESEVGRLTGELNRFYRIVVSNPAHTREEVAALATGPPRRLGPSTSGIAG